MAGPKERFYLPAWQKALWPTQPFDDNYTDELFLESLVVNADVAQRNFWRVVWGAVAVDQQLCIASIVASIAYSLYKGALQAPTLFIWEVIVFVLGFIVKKLLKSQASNTAQMGFALTVGMLQAVAKSAWLLILLAGLSPVYATLTASISADTTVACTCLLLLAHLYLHDYGRTPPNRPSMMGSLSLSCSMCASILMASQLQTLPHVFALMILSMEAYILFPHLQHALLQEIPAAAPMFSFAGLCAAATFLVSQHSVVLTSALLCSMAFITILCPMWLVRIQKFKAQINGPWDEAVPKLTTAVSDSIAIAKQAQRLA